MVSFVSRVLKHRVQAWQMAALGLGSVAALSVVSNAFGAEPTYAQQAKDRRLVVVELFTSQGCSSCPPADQLQAELAKRGDILALTFPVNYWDFLGWRDTLASPVNAERQMSYAQRSQRGSVFTPQVIVDGMRSVIGSKRENVLAEIAKRRANGQSLVPLRIEVKDDRVFVTLPKAAGALANAESGTATLWLFPFGQSDIVQIAKGENRGRSMIYAHVVRDQIGLGQWAGEAATYEHTLTEGERNQFGYAAVLQEDKVGPVIGAAWAGDMEHIHPAPMAPEPAMAADPLLVSLPR